MQILILRYSQTLVSGSNTYEVNLCLAFHLTWDKDSVYLLKLCQEKGKIMVNYKKITASAFHILGDIGIEFFAL